jgi:hypothetical protein
VFLSDPGDNRKNFRRDYWKTTMVAAATTYGKLGINGTAFKLVV